jgi:hypothetical protein
MYGKALPARKWRVKIDFRETGGENMNWTETGQNSQTISIHISTVESKNHGLSASCKYNT